MTCILGAVKNLNAVYSSLAMRRRYEVWFLRLGLADGSGAWWFRYLLLNPGHSGCKDNPAGMPVQVWATWFPRGARPQSFIQGFSMEGLHLSERRAGPFFLEAGKNRIDDDSCSGSIESGGHRVEWQLNYRSDFGITLSNKGWIGFSRSPHFNAEFAGEIRFDGMRFTGSPLGFGVQGHNCGYRHRNQWTWTHACFADPTTGITALEALVYEMPLGMRFRTAALWHQGRAYLFRKLSEHRRDPEGLRWEFEARDRYGNQLFVQADGSGDSLHRLPYLKTDCSGNFTVANNSLAQACVKFRLDDSPGEFRTTSGAVLEMAG